MIWRSEPKTSKKPDVKGQAFARGANNWLQYLVNYCFPRILYFVSLDLLSNSFGKLQRYQVLYWSL